MYTSVARDIKVKATTIKHFFLHIGISMCYVHPSVLCAQMKRFNVKKKNLECTRLISLLLSSTWQ